MFKKNSHNRLKNSQNIAKSCAEHQKPDAFQRFSPTFQKLFLKSDFFDSLNGLRHRPRGRSPRVGYAPSGVLRSTLVRAGGRDWAPSRRSPGTRSRRFDGTNFKPHELPDCPQGVRTPSQGRHAAQPPPWLWCSPGDRVHPGMTDRHVSRRNWSQF